MADTRGLPAICLLCKMLNYHTPINMQNQHVLMKNEITLQASHTRLSSFDGIHYNRASVHQGPRETSGKISI